MSGNVDYSGVYGIDRRELINRRAMERQQAMDSQQVQRDAPPADPALGRLYPREADPATDPANRPPPPPRPAHAQPALDDALPRCGDRLRYDSPPTLDAIEVAAPSASVQRRGGHAHSTPWPGHGDRVGTAADDDDNEEAKFARAWAVAASAAAAAATHECSRCLDSDSEAEDGYSDEDYTDEDYTDEDDVDGGSDEDEDEQEPGTADAVRVAGRVSTPELIQQFRQRQQQQQPAICSGSGEASGGVVANRHTTLWDGDRKRKADDVEAAAADDREEREEREERERKRMALMDLLFPPGEDGQESAPPGGAGTVVPEVVSAETVLPDIVVSEAAGPEVAE